jgi:hypothetical protein
LASYTCFYGEQTTSINSLNSLRAHTIERTSPNPKNDETMKTMICRQLGGACDKTFSADTSNKMAELSKQHDGKLHQKKDTNHFQAMGEIQ